MSNTILSPLAARDQAMRPQTVAQALGKNMNNPIIQTLSPGEVNNLSAIQKITAGLNESRPHPDRAYLRK